MRLRNVPFFPVHIDQIRLKPVHAGETRGLKERIVEAGSRRGSVIFTVMGPQGPVAVAGILLLHSGSGEAWSIMGVEVDRYGLEFARLMHRTLEGYFRLLELRRLQILARSGHPEVERWVRFLGFQCEGLLRRYGLDAADYFLFSRVA